MIYLKHFTVAILSLLSCSVVKASNSLEHTVNDLFEVSTGWFVSIIFAPLPGTHFPWIVLWLVSGAALFTLYFRFVQFRWIRHSFRLVRGDFSNPQDAGEVSHFQALTTALSGTVGLGNIAGVAVAISIGGPGATFWMIVAGLLGMASKFVECTLAVKYREEKADGSISGGPMYYLSKGFLERNLPLGKVLSYLFACFCVLASLGGGNMFQSNQAHQQLASVLGDFPSWVTGVIFSTVVFLVILGGIKSIARITERVVPFMAILYVGTSLYIIIANADALGWAFGQIIEGAFTGLGVTGGMLGALIQGFKRAAFSNEAGVGSAAIAHAAVQTKHPITEGLVSLLEPFIDTVVICTMTALVIIITGQLVIDPDTGLYVLNHAGHIQTTSGTSGVALTSSAFSSVVGWFPYILMVSVVLFAFSTMLGWSYYGLKAWTYIFGDGSFSNLVYKVVFCLFSFLGAVISLGAVIDFSDAAIFAMAVVNVIGLVLLMPIVKSELDNYAKEVNK